MLIAYFINFLFALAIGTGVGGGAGTLWFIALFIAGSIAIAMVGSMRAREVAAQDFSEAKARADAQLTAWFDLCRDRHRDALVTRYRQLVRRDAYGNLELKPWKQELDRVVTAVGMRPDDPLRPWFETGLTALVETWIKQEEAESTGAGFASSDPIEYEHWCAAELRRGGWNATTTTTSGDQGLDILAVKNGRKVAIQCKLYTKPVGNRAVQEVHAAASFVEAGTAIVVAPVDFTPSARELASKLGVLLLHHAQLAKLDTVLQQRA